ncbi:MAG: glycosyltransferase, partial [Armatimonadetes bacterium]|nr:glycosyltransferase [Armatimonadota bacterium]
MISAVIPALNEAKGLSQTLGQARSALGRDAELIVVDGGSMDETVAVAERQGARVIASPRGRGRQMNAGATAAQGDLLLFLHADTLLPPEAGRLIQEAARDPRVLGGNFPLRFDAPGVLPALFAAVYDARSRRQRLFY